ncbi:MAG: glycoside hydrolase family 57 protein [Gammaproteobacteria bacterium]
MSDSIKQHQPLNVVLYWHMHQPEYRDLRNGEYHQPWTYLHTIKDYVDMVAHLENNEKARAVVNFAPVLLEQIDDYAFQLGEYLHHGGALRDPLLSSLAGPILTLDQENRIHILKSCLRANKKRLVQRFETFNNLVKIGEEALDKPQTLTYYSEQFFVDILVWYHLAWMAETVRNSDIRIKSLMKKAQHFTIHDRRSLVEVIYELISSVISRYRRLAEQQRIELSMTPYAHPIVPLLLDLKSTKQALPDAEMPVASEYPGGLERSQWHVKKAVEVFKKYFGSIPGGCWPSEGSISAETLELLSEMDISWVASGESVLQNSLKKSGVEVSGCLHEAYQYKNIGMTCFFRDDGLSDLIGFKYSDWHADDAVANLVHHLEKIAEECTHTPGAIVSIILDGENAWEYYPENGFYFITALYKQLAEHENLKLTTYSEYLESHTEKKTLNDIVAGSWVYGTFSTWIGEKDKNRAWDMLVEAKNTYDRVIASGNLSDEEIVAAEMQLATCESSDWFWWFGEYNSAESVSAFDEQYRLHLCNLYQLLKQEPPEYLAHAFSFGTGNPLMGGTMLPGQQQ